MGSLQSQLNDISKTLTTMAAQIHDLARKFDTLEPLIPLAKKLNGIPDRVTQMQASVFEYTEQVHALHLVVQRVEQAQRGCTSAPTTPPDQIGPSRPSGPPPPFPRVGRFVPNESGSAFH
ncbi:hypothetical protein E2562_011041 [Oryza meyeriana var. granulata]|uniref:Uncharacterized protein n=1 Tax=Oryza meyeriana var. granulata TaxID=110450 RepID=A0A6G1EWE0_9ORYZ|nr:hypothetical protein E2562_011041 [Oryza meyeriana var. granulata]